MRYLVVPAAVACFAYTVTAAPVVPNPSFELPGHSGDAFVVLHPSTAANYITGWTIGGAGIDYFKNTTASTFASDGQYSVNYVRGPGDSGWVSTTISGLVAGSAYELSFDLIQSELVPGAALTAKVDAYEDTFLNSVPSLFQRRTLSFIAAGSTAALTFASQSSGSRDSAYAHVDNVSVASVAPVVPTPAALPAGAACLGALAFRRLLRPRS